MQPISFPDREKSIGKNGEKSREKANKKIARVIQGMNVYEQIKIDKKLIELDGTENKERLGANAILGVSLAVAKAAANSLGMSLYNYIGGINSKMLPIPMMNIMNGGKHADNDLNIQEFMIMPTGATSFKESLRMGVEVYYNLKRILKSRGLSTAVGDEGGFAPNLSNEEEAIELILKAIAQSGYIPGKDISLALDIAAKDTPNRKRWILFLENR